ncbi:MAG: Ig-like domain repeat protein, partial [Methanosphaera sp.]|nr:Ig-like domain repeat protein [Methanosphaera sp.]
TNKTEILAESIESIEGDVTYENLHFKKLTSINGDVTLINCSLDLGEEMWGMMFYNSINNMGKLSLINCELNCGFNNTGEMIIDNCTCPQSYFYTSNKLEIKNVDWTFYGQYMEEGMNDIIHFAAETVIRNSTFSSISENFVIGELSDVSNNILYVYDSNFTDIFLKYNMPNTTIIFNNSHVKNNKYYLDTLFNVKEISLVDSSFEDNSNPNIVESKTRCYVNNCTFNNNNIDSDIVYDTKNVIKATEIYINNSVFKNHVLNSSIIQANGNCNISNTTFEDNTVPFSSNGDLDTGIAINLQPTGDNVIYITNNMFKNNYIDAIEGVILTYFGKSHDFTRNGFGTDISCGVNEYSNDVNGNNNQIIITNNQFINSETTQKAGSIFINFNETFDNNSLTIKNNTFDNVKSKSETIIYNNTQNVDIADNTFINCAIDLDEFTLSSPQDTLTISPETPITLNIQATLTNPEYYDSDLLDKNEYQIFINDENVYNTTENEFTFNSDVYGTLTMYVVNPAINNKTNDITVTVTKKEIVISPINAAVGDKVTLRAEIKVNDELQSDLNSGKVTFKINGKTVKDENGKVVYAKVVNGVAIIEDYEVPQEWAKEDSTIQAVYSGSNQLEKFSSEKTEITIAPTIPTLTTESITSTAGETITLTATITDNNKVINNDKIVFKINGKTVKDENGKVIYAKVVDNSVSVDYVIPDSYKTGDYTITAVYISNDYDRLEDSKTLTII